MFCCGCIFLVIFASLPRLGLLALWLFTDYVTKAFDGWIAPLLGLIFLPFTTVAYVLLYNPVQGLTFWGWVLIIFAFMLDLGAWAGKANSAKGKLY